MKKRVIHASLVILIGLFVPIILAEIALQAIGVYGGLQPQPVNKENPIRRYAPNQEFYYTYGPFFESRNSGVVNNYGFVKAHHMLKLLRNSNSAFNFLLRVIYCVCGF